MVSMFQVSFCMRLRALLPALGQLFLLTRAARIQAYGDMGC